MKESALVLESRERVGVLVVKDVEDPFRGGVAAFQQDKGRALTGNDAADVLHWSVQWRGQELALAAWTDVQME